MREIFRAFANDMELQENSIIVSDRLDGVFDVELRNHFTHAYCTAGECEMSYNGEGIRVAKGDSQIATIQERLAQASAARQQEAETGVTVYPPKAKPMTDEEIARLPFALYREGQFYYVTSPYAHANDGATAHVSCLLDLMMWDATDRMALITQPLLMMTGEKSDSRYMTEEAMEKATGTQEKEMFVVPGASHIKTYYEPAFVEQERAKVVAFFDKYLAKP